MSKPSGDDVAAAYDAIAGDFHLVHSDWRATVVAQGQALDGLLESLLGQRGLRILDCSCGIGTQAIGLALQGHDVVATDISPAAVERAGAEAPSFGIALDVRVADMRHLTAVVAGEFDVVLSCDNSVAHLGPAELVRALGEMRSLISRGGVALLGLRDYERLSADRPAVTSLAVSGAAGTRAVTFQLWEWWPGGEGYDATLFFLEERTGWRPATHAFRLHAHRRATVAAAMEGAGLREARWHEPEASGYYQPVVTARRP